MSNATSPPAVSQKTWNSMIADLTGEEFGWGEVRALHEVGPYLIVEYVEDRPSNAKEDWSPSISFSLFVAVPTGESDVRFSRTGKSFGSLDQALIGGVVFRAEWEHNGINAALNERLTGYITRILDI